MTPARTLSTVSLLSALTLAFQLLQTRVLSVIYWNHLVYFVITMALLGLAAGGTAFSLSSRLQSIAVQRVSCVSLAGFSYSALLGTHAITRLPVVSYNLWNSPSTPVVLVLSYVLAMVPFFFFGLFMASTFSRYPTKPGVIYFCNLIGSAAGCLLYIFLIKPLGAVLLLLFIFAIGSLVAISLQQDRRPHVVSFQIVGVIILSVTTAATLRIWPEINKRFWRIRNRVVEFSQWNAISRVDVLSQKEDPNIKIILIDGDAMCQLVHPRDTRAQNGELSPHRELSYVVLRDRQVNNALVIGAGGGADVLMAYKHGASLIDAVEINPTTASIVANQYSSFIGDVFHTNPVKLHIEDGRSFIRRSDRLYDVIMLFGVDSFSALSGGAYVLSESYLYTVDALSDYWAHLAPEGIIQISRWYYPEAPRETLRAFTTAYEALSKQGVDPSRHLLVVGDASGDAPFADLLISRRPFVEKDILIIVDWLKRHAQATNWLDQPTRSHLVYSPLSADSYQVAAALGKNPFSSFIEASRKGQEEEFFENYEFNVRPVTDDNPFFFQYGRWSHVLKPYSIGPKRFESIQGKWPFLVLLSTTFLSIILVTLLIWLPMFAWKKKAGDSVHVPVLFYFSLLGFAFIFVEMAILQRVVVLLGHPMYSMAVTIPTMLIAAGVGSICSGSIKVEHTTVAVSLSVTGICLLLVTWIFAGSVIVHTLQPYSTTYKIVAIVAVISPLGVLMGLLFPIGIRKLSGLPRMIPIAWAANGGTSVIGSIVAVVIAMTRGFAWVLASAAALYMMAALSFFMWQAKKESTS